MVSDRCLIIVFLIIFTIWAIGIWVGIYEMSRRNSGKRNLRVSHIYPHSISIPTLEDLSINNDTKSLFEGITSQDVMKKPSIMKNIFPNVKSFAIRPPDYSGDSSSISGGTGSIPARAPKLISALADLKSQGGTTLLSRNDSVKITCDVQGNLGPCTVLNQDPPGNDWLVDRWQAASDMAGTAIRGTHWVQLEFDEIITASRIVLDWETSYANAYRLEYRLDPPVSKLRGDDKWKVLYNGLIPNTNQTYVIFHRFLMNFFDTICKVFVCLYVYVCACMMMKILLVLRMLIVC